MIVEIPVYIENIIKQQAEQQGITAEQLVQQSLANQFATTQTKVERPFNFDMDDMDKAINGNFVEMPKGMAKDFEAFSKWLDGAFQ